MANALADAAKLLERGSGIEQLLVWTGAGLRSALQSPGFVEDQATELTALVLDAAAHERSRRVARARNAFLRGSALQHTPLLRELASGLVKRHASCGPPRGAADAYATLELVACVLAALPADGGGKATGRLLELAGACLDGLLPLETAQHCDTIASARGVSSAQRRWRAAVRVVTRLLVVAPHLRPAFLHTTTNSPGLARALLDAACAPRSPLLWDDVMDALLPGALERLLLSPAPPSSAIAAGYAPLLRALSPEQLIESVAPAFSRGVRRAPEAAIAGLSVILAALAADASASAAELGRLLVAQLRGRETSRTPALAALAALAARVGQSGPAGELLGAVNGVLDGSAEGRVRVAGERVALARGLGALSPLAAAVGGGDAAMQLAARAVATAATTYKEEPVEEVKVALLGALGQWLPAVPVTPPADAVTVLRTSLSEAKDGPRRAALAAAAAALAAAPELAVPLAPLATELVALASEGATKAVSRGPGLCALALAAALEGASSQALVRLCGESSPLLSAATLARLPPSEAAAAAGVARALLSTYETLPPDVTPALSRALCACLLHHAPEPRRAGAAAACVLVTERPTLLPALVAALRHWANEQADATMLTDGGEAVSAVPGTYSARFRWALLALLPRTPEVARAALGSDGLPQVLLMAAHPAITAGVADKLSTWRAAVARLGETTGQLLKAGTPSVLAVLLGPDGLGSTCASEVTAAQLALRAAASVAPGPVLAQLVDALTPWLDRAAHDLLSDAEIAAFSAPPGMLAAEAAAAAAGLGGYQAEVVASRNVRRPRGRFKSDKRAFATPSDDDEEDEPPAPPSRMAPAARTGSAAGRGGAAGGAAGGAGRGAKDAATRQAQLRAQRLAEEAEVRAAVTAIKARLEVGLGALAAAVMGGRLAAGPLLEELGACVIPLLGSPLVGGAALDAAAALAACLPAPLCARARQLAGCLAAVAVAGGGPPPSMLQDVLDALRAAVVAPAPPLPGPALRLIFPLLAAALSSGASGPSLDAALEVLGLHAGPDAGLPHGATLTLLYGALESAPATRDRVVPLLSELCRGLKDDELPAAVGGLLLGSPAVRGAALAALPGVPLLNKGSPPPDPAVCAVLALARRDVDDDNAAAAEALWHQTHCSLDALHATVLVGHLRSTSPDVRAAAASALADVLSLQLHAAPATLDAVLALASSASNSDEDDDDDRNGDAHGLRSSDGGLAVLPPEPNSAAAAAAAAAEAEKAASLHGVAAGLAGLAAVLPPPQVEAGLDFLVAHGLGAADEGVRADMLDAGVALIEAHGGELAPVLLPRFEAYLDTGGCGAGRQADEEAADRVRQGVVVLLGRMAGHLPPGNDKRGTVVSLLLDVLDTPSEAVQRSVADCLPRLVAPLATDRPAADALLDRLLDRLRAGGPSGYGLRRGAAYGLSGVVRGLGTGCLKGQGVLERLRALLEERGDAAAREGGLLAYECLAGRLGRLFEPYVITTLPLLLAAFGDGAPQVRAAAEDAAREMMGQLSASGVKLVLPALLAGLEEPAWRTKAGSVQLLGAMAHCAPRQLGSCLPTIVPRLGAVLADPHPKVQAAARDALQEVGSVVRSPELAALVPVLLGAIADPQSSTRPCLDALLGTTFAHTLDAPSLALLVPVLHRGLRDRGGDTKKRAARIVGSMAGLTTDAKDMLPYVPLLLPELQKALLDPLPEVRATAARAMGCLLRGMGPSALGELLPWLLDTLSSDGSSVERSGAAQGLAEVLAVLGTAHLTELLPELVASARARSPYVREGHLTLFRYLPLTMPEAFQVHLGIVLPVILDGLSDEAEGVRDAALAAGRCFVDAYARSCLPLLLPAVEAGLDGEAWRMRQASLELCGELLFKVAGTSGRVKLDGGSDDEGAACESHGAALSSALGRERYAEVLARLYLARSDAAYGVRNTALHIWKTLVVNTPRTLQDVLPALMAEVIRALADPGEDRRACGARSLGELVRKMGERVLHRMLPILRDGMASPVAATRQGVCAGLKELLENVTRHQLSEHLSDILPPVQGALCDPDPGVRDAAGAAFGVLFRGGSHSAVEGVVPSLLLGLEAPSHSAASLEGLRVILGVRPALFSGVAPKLLRPPLTSARLAALGALAGSAGGVLLHHIPAILAACLPLAGEHAIAHAQQPQQAQSPEDPNEDHRCAAAANAVLAVALACEEDVQHVLVAELLRALETGGVAGLGAATLLAQVASRTDLAQHVDALLAALILLLADDDDALVMGAWRGAEALLASVPKEEAAGHVAALRDAFSGARERQRRKRRGGDLQLRGLTLPPKALAPFVPIYLAGVLQGSSPEVREAAADGLGELVALSGPEALRPHVVGVTGPLIRVLGDRFPPATRAAILRTLGLLLSRAGPGLKPFVPQLQTTFLKCLADEAAAVRTVAASNLGELAGLSARAEALLSDLANSAASAAQPELASAYLVALRGGLAAAGGRLSSVALEAVRARLLGMYAAADRGGSGDEYAGLAAALACTLAELCAAEGGPALRAVLGAGPLAQSPPSAGTTPAASAMLLAAVAGRCGAALGDEGVLAAATDAALRNARHSEPSVKVAGGRALCRLFLASSPGVDAGVTAALQAGLLALLGPDQTGEVSRQALLSLGRLAVAADADALAPLLGALLPSVCGVLQREPSSSIRAAAEQCLRKLLRPEGAAGMEAAQAAAAAAGGTTRTFLTDAYLRRLQKLGEDEWVEVEDY